MREICPNCEKKTDIEVVRSREHIDVRGESIEVPVEYFKCHECGELFENTRGHDPYALAYKEYRCRHSMIQPEEIREWRKRYGLTQKELSQILGWGGATLSRYENGALQVDSHEKLLRLAMEPHNLRKLIEDCPSALSVEKHARIMKEIKVEEDESSSFELLFEDKFGHYAPDEYSGFNSFQISKLFNAIIFFCKGGVLKTKLNKLMFYADFKYFKEYSLSITGAHYVHLEHGPVPDNYDFFTAELQKGNELEVEEILFGEYSGYKLNARVEPDLSVFSDSELKTLVDVKEHFKSFNSSKIRDFSHKERAYRDTASGSVISYLYATDLQI